MATNHTTNYNLNLWEPQDDFLRTEFNENFNKIDAALACKFGTDKMPWVIGSYVGDATAEREIDLGFKPAFLFIIGNSNGEIGFAISGEEGEIAHGYVGEQRTGPNQSLMLTDTGFKTKALPYYSTFRYYMNLENCLYFYFAIR